MEPRAEPAGDAREILPCGRVGEQASARARRTRGTHPRLAREREQRERIAERIGVRLEQRRRRWSWRRGARSWRRDAKRQLPRPRHPHHLLPARPFRARRETEVRERSANRGGLGILEARDGVHVTIALALERPSGGGGMGVVGSAVHARPEDHGARVPFDERGDDPSGGIALVEQGDAGA
jgi:hypothetical protein